jgi:hypothetical protein
MDVLEHNAELIEEFQKKVRARGAANANPKIRAVYASVEAMRAWSAERDMERPARPAGAQAPAYPRRDLVDGGTETGMSPSEPVPLTMRASL